MNNPVFGPQRTGLAPLVMNHIQGLEKRCLPLICPIYFKCSNQLVRFEVYCRYDIIPVKKTTCALNVGPDVALFVGKILRSLSATKPNSSISSRAVKSLSDESNSSVHCRDASTVVSTVFLSCLWVSPLLLFSAPILA